MNSEIVDLLELVSQSIGNENRNYDFSQANWKEVLQLTAKHKMIPIVCDRIFELNKDTPVDIALLDACKKSTVLSIMKEKQKLLAIHEIIEAAKKEKLVFVIFKGCILGNLYPQFGMRSNSDTDILANPEDREKATKIFLELGYYKDEENSKEHVYVMRNKVLKHVVELHFYLWEDYTGKRINIISDMNLSNLDTLIPIEVMGFSVLTLGHTEHLIYQMFHIVKHFSVEGVGIRYLLDIALFINNYFDEIDMNKFWFSMELLGYDKFCQQFFLISMKYFGLRNDCVNDKIINEDFQMEMLILDLINMGNMSDVASGNYQILGIMTPYFVGNSNISNSKIGRIVQVLFPFQIAMRDDFAYAKKYKILLPIAWIHRFFDYIIFRITHKGIAYGVNDKLKISEHRIKMMKNMGLLEEKDER